MRRAHASARWHAPRSCRPPETTNPGGAGVRAVRRLTLSAVAEVRLHLLVLALDVDADGGGGPGQQARDADRLAGLDAVAVLLVADAAQRLVDLAQQHRFALAQAQVEPVLFLGGGAVGRVGEDLPLVQALLHIELARQHFLAHLHQQPAEEVELHVVHVLLVRHRADVVLGQLLAELERLRLAHRHRLDRVVVLGGDRTCSPRLFHGAYSVGIVIWTGASAVACGAAAGLGAAAGVGCGAAVGAGAGAGGGVGAGPRAGRGAARRFGFFFWTGLGATFLATGFLAGAFFGAGFFAGAFLATALTFFAAFLATVLAFFATFFTALAAFFAADFFAALATGFFLPFAAAFLVVTDVSVVMVLLRCRFVALEQQSWGVIAPVLGNVNEKPDRLATPRERSSFACAGATLWGDPALFRSPRRTRSRDPDPVGGGHGRSPHRQLLDARAGRAAMVAAHLSGIRHEAPAGGRQRTGLPDRPGVPARGGRAPP